MKRRILLRGGALAAATAVTATLTGCASPQIADYAAEKPALDLRQYFNGTLDAYGMFTDRSGAVIKRFTVVMTCSWTGDEGVLDEDFTYSDGARQRRIWRLTRSVDAAGQVQYIGRADDVVGVAKGEERGNALRWRYTLMLPVDKTVYEVQFDDWMYLMSDRVMLNKATMSKFGVRLGEVTLSFLKR